MMVVDDIGLVLVVILQKLTLLNFVCVLLFLICSLLLSFLVIFFFFSSRRRHTRCSRDLSSDVCSSDLASRPALAPPAPLDGSGPPTGRWPRCESPLLRRLSSWAPGHDDVHDRAGCGQGARPRLLPQDRKSVV